MSDGHASRVLAAVVSLAAACAGAAGQSEDDRFRSALGQAPPMVNPALSHAVDPAVSSNWDSTYRLLSYSTSEACFLAEWNVPAHLAPSLHFKLEGWLSLGQERQTVPFVMSRSVEVLDGATVARIKSADRPVDPAADPAAEARAMAPPLTPMRVCFPPTVIRSQTRYLTIFVEYDAHHRTGAGWRLVPARRP